MKILFAITFLVYSMQLVAQVEPSITFDPETGNYIIEYSGEDSLVHVIFEPSTKIDPFVITKVAKDIDSNYFIYQYEVMNGESSMQRLEDFDLEIFSSINEITNPEYFWKHSYYSFVPVFGWYCSKGEAGLAHPLDGIAPDSSEDGFSFKSYGLPSILHSFLSGNHTIPLAIPDEPPGEISELLKPLRKFPNNTVIKETIGPKDPPDPFIPSNFLDTLFNYNQRSLELGWIANQATADKYDTLFTTAKTLLEENHIPWVEYTLQTVIDECNEDSSGNITSEAYALLRYNTEYLLEHLPEVIPPVLTSISPAIVLRYISGGVPPSGLTVTVTGANFSDSSVAYFNGIAKTTTVVSDTVLTFPITGSEMSTLGNYFVWISTYGSNSDTLTFYVVDNLPQTLAPTLQCVHFNGGSSYTAYFGYNNDNSVSVYVPLGSKNKFSPSPIDRGQPNLFLPGSYTSVFSVNFDGSNITWTLDQTSTTANKKSEPCP